MPTHYHGTLQEELALNTFIKFTRASNSFEARMLSFYSSEKLTPSQFGVLETLHHLGPLCQGELSNKLLKSTGNITLVLDNLEKQSLIRRMRESEDRRMVTIHLTPAGEALIAEIFPRFVEHLQASLAPLSAEEMQVFGALCRKLGTHSG